MVREQKQCPISKNQNNKKVSKSAICDTYWLHSGQNISTTTTANVYKNATKVAKAAMMVALSGGVALVVTVLNHKTMAKGGAQTRPPTTQCCTLFN